MPILRAEPVLQSEEIFASDLTSFHEGRWWVLHTKPRQEKSLARWLHATRIDFYLPTIEHRSRIRGRIVTAHLPLFPGYLFLHADQERRVASLTTNRVVRCLDVDNQHEFWNDLRQIHRLLASGLPVMPEQNLGPGMRVEITSGMLTGLTGTIVRSASGRRFVVRVDFIQQGASVLIEDFALSPIAC